SDQAPMRPRNRSPNPMVTLGRSLARRMPSAWHEGRLHHRKEAKAKQKKRNLLYIYRLTTDRASAYAIPAKGGVIELVT
ncbi:MAG: hypothetical protein ACREA0_24425, partial [bacterium]